MAERATNVHVRGRAKKFYVNVMKELQNAKVPFLVGGYFALKHFTGINRPTKDLDLFLRPTDVDRALRVLSKAGFRTERPEPIWLAKAHHQHYFVDLVYRSGNGLAEVDDRWFAYSRTGEVFDMEVDLCPPEETLWSKAFTMERERFDGADVLHLIRTCGADFDWPRLLERFGEQWRVLFSYVVLFGFVYPADEDLIPDSVRETLLNRYLHETTVHRSTRVCRGPLLSRRQFKHDISDWGYTDARFQPRGSLTAKDIEAWRKFARKEQLKPAPEPHPQPTHRRAV